MKLGLALSGGGFRASLFHIGVLARMAEYGILRQVEVISAVSGGAILGALYYAHVKRLLETREDQEVTDDDYLAIVQRIEREFLAAVQKNIRLRTFGDPVKNVHMTFANYSRSDRIGELYDELLYRPALAAGRSGAILMRELKITPMGGRTDFHPRLHNQGRNAKVPILVLNATALNTGHNWRFEASRMGEPPRSDPVAQDVDKNMRLRRPPSYEAITPLQQDFELGHAVAASAGVPGIFPPLSVSGLYDQRIRVQLVDGGVHDNQGIQGLLDEKCNAFVVSDASGQMLDETDPATGLLQVLLRSNDILMDRVREEELFSLLGGGQQPVGFMHLRKGVSAQAIGWIDQNGNPAARQTERIPATASQEFGVDPSVQELLSKIRTDLDSFTDIEGHSLMLDGYLMSEPELKRAFNVSPPPRSISWQFLDIRKWVAKPTPQYLAHLEVGQERLFKVFRLSWSVTFAVFLLLGFIGWGLWIWQQERILDWWNATLSIKQLIAGLLVLVLGFIPWASRMFKILRFLRSPSEIVLRIVLRGFLPAIGSIFVWIYLYTFDALFMSLGRVRRLR